ncbi:MAG: hypothetical protein Q4D50_13180 [Eubacteriales bacterium]|nr:hypothetical protein [Eubacteriales bacterium]
MIYFAPILLIINVGLIPMINAGLLRKAFAPYLRAALETEKENDPPGLDEKMAIDD